jgi:hypothetical protein
MKFCSQTNGESWIFVVVGDRVLRWIRPTWSGDDIVDSTSPRPRALVVRSAALPSEAESCH